MAAVRVHETGGPSQLSVERVPIPETPPGYVLVRNQFSGVNFHDTYTRSGLYPRQLPFVSGCEGGGEVVAHTAASKDGSSLTLVGAQCVYFDYEHGS